MNVTLDQLRAAFTEWDRRYREDPEGFEDEAARLLNGASETYGDAAAPYFASILEEAADTAHVAASAE